MVTSSLDRLSHCIGSSRYSICLHGLVTVERDSSCLTMLAWQWCTVIMNRIPYPEKLMQLVRDVFGNLNVQILTSICKVFPGSVIARSKYFILHMMFAPYASSLWNVGYATVLSDLESCDAVSSNFHFC